MQNVYPLPTFFIEKTVAKLEKNKRTYELFNLPTKHYKNMPQNFIISRFRHSVITSQKRQEKKTALVG